MPSGTRRIYLSDGTWALVDEADAKRVAQFDWEMSRSARTTYARTSSKRLGSNWRLMHRLVLDARPGEIVDHINGNGLDNRRANLRLVTAAQNARNQFVQAGPKTSRFKGVSWDAVAARWAARITVDGFAIDLGRFDVEEEAARAYDAASLERHGEHGRTNASMGLFAGMEPVERNVEFERGARELVPNQTDPVLRGKRVRRYHLQQKRIAASARRFQERYGA